MDPDTPTRPMGVMEEYYRENSHYWVRESAMRHILDAAVKRREAQIQIEAGNDSYHATPYLIVVPSGDLRRQYFCLTEIYPQLDVVVFDPCGHVHFWDDAPFVLVSWEKCVESIQRWIANSDIAETANTLVMMDSRAFTHFQYGISGMPKPDLTPQEREYRSYMDDDDLPPNTRGIFAECERDNQWNFLGGKLDYEVLLMYQVLFLHGREGVDGQEILPLLVPGRILDPATIYGDTDTSSLPDLPSPVSGSPSPDSSSDSDNGPPRGAMFPDIDSSSDDEMGDIPDDGTTDTSDHEMSDISDDDSEATGIAEDDP